VYVGNLSYEVAWQDLKDHMRKVGRERGREGGREGRREKGKESLSREGGREIGGEGGREEKFRLIVSFFVYMYLHPPSPRSLPPPLPPSLPPSFFPLGGQRRARRCA